MNTYTLAILASVGLAVVAAVGDYFLKHASMQQSPLTSGYFALGVMVFCVSLVGWVYVMQHLKLATIGTVYCVATVLLLAGIGMLFGERLNVREVLGMLLGISSITLLMRFS